MTISETKKRIGAAFISGRVLHTTSVRNLDALACSHTELLEILSELMIGFTFNSELAERIEAVMERAK